MTWGGCGKFQALSWTAIFPFAIDEETTDVNLPGRLNFDAGDTWLKPIDL